MRNLSRQKIRQTLKLLRIFDEIFDVINGDPFLTLYKTSAIIFNWKFTFLKVWGIQIEESPNRR